MVLDKTGTVTTGQMTLTHVRTAGGLTRDELLRYAGAVEQASEHAVAAAITAAAITAAAMTPPTARYPWPGDSGPCPAWGPAPWSRAGRSSSAGPAC